MKVAKTVCFFLSLIIPFTAVAQRAAKRPLKPRTLEGIVVGKEEGPRWIGIVVESAGVRYLVTISNNPDNNIRDPVVLGGDIETPGIWVRVTYTSSEPWSGSMIAVNATRVVRLRDQIISPIVSRHEPSGSTTASEILEFELPLGRTINGFSYTRGGNLTYNRKSFSPTILANPRDIHGFRISFLPTKGMAGAISLHSEGQNKSFLLDTHALHSTPMQPGNQWNAAQKLLWSPSQRYMVALCAYEGERFIRIDLNTKRVLEGDFLVRGTRIARITNDPRWLGNSDILVFTVNEYCNPYDGDPNCTGERVGRITSSYEARMDVATLRLLHR